MGKPRLLGRTGDGPGSRRALCRVSNRGKERLVEKRRYRALLAIERAIFDGGKLTKMKNKELRVKG